jgi:CheY-like chemotaxis protein
MSNATKILVVDDEPIGRQLLEAILIPEGYQIFFGSDGEEALQIATREQPDIILLDVMMPKKDGFQTCREIRSNNKTAHIPVFLITALDDRDSRIRGIDAGADDYISKPFDRVEILGKIKNKSTQIDFRKKEQSRRVKDNTDKSDSLAGISLIDLLIESVYQKEQSDMEFTLFHSRRNSDSKHSFYCHVTAEARYYFIISNKLPDKDAAIANAILSQYFNRLITENNNTSSALHSKLASEINTVISEVGIFDAQLSGFSFAILKIDDNKLYATGKRQNLFICQHVSNNGHDKFKSFKLNDAGELTFGLSSTLIILSPNINEHYQPDEILKFLDIQFSHPTNSPFSDIIHREYEKLMDYLVVKLIV